MSQVENRFRRHIPKSFSWVDGDVASMSVKIATVVMYGMVAAVNAWDPPTYAHLNILWVLWSALAAVTTTIVLLKPCAPAVELAAASTVSASMFRGVQLVWGLMFEPEVFGPNKNSFWIGAATWVAVSFLLLFYWLNLPRKMLRVAAGDKGESC